jgi:glutaredoxin
VGGPCGHLLYDYYTQRRKAGVVALRNPTMYTIITRNNCKYCDKAKTMLADKKIQYVTYNIEETSSKWLLSLMVKANLKHVPQVFASDGGDIGGFRELESKMTFIGNKEY